MCLTERALLFVSEQISIQRVAAGTPHPVYSFLDTVSFLKCGF